jgi:hypothetical protein
MGDTATVDMAHLQWQRYRIATPGVGALVLILLTSNTGFCQSNNRLQWSFQPKTLKVWTAPNVWPADSAVQISQMEQQLYNKTYITEPPAIRAARLEQSLGLTGDRGFGRNTPPSERLRQLNHVMAHSAQQPVNQRARVSIGLLEQRLFHTRFEQWPLTQRLAQLEQAVFGQVYDQQANPDRLHRLFDQIPLSNRSVRMIMNQSK